MERSRDLPLRRLRLHAELPLTDGQPEGAVELGEDVEDGDEGRGFADYVKRPWEVGAFDLEVGCGGCSGGLEEGSLGELERWGGVGGCCLKGKGDVEEESRVVGVEAEGATDLDGATW